MKYGAKLGTYIETEGVRANVVRQCEIHGRCRQECNATANVDAVFDHLVDGVRGIPVLQEAVQRR